MCSRLLEDTHSREAALLPRVSSGYLLRKHRGSMLYPLRAEDRSRDPNPGGSCIHANCIVASLWTHEDRQENNPHVLTGMSAWTDIYAMCGATVCCRARANGPSPSTLWKAVRSGRSSSSTLAYSPVVGLEGPYMSGISAPDVPLPPRSYAHCY